MLWLPTSHLGVSDESFAAVEGLISGLSDVISNPALSQETVRVTVDTARDKAAVATGGATERATKHTGSVTHVGGSPREVGLSRCPRTHGCEVRRAQEHYLRLWPSRHLSTGRAQQQRYQAGPCESLRPQAQCKTQAGI